MSNKDFILRIPTQSTNLKIIRDFITDISQRAGFDNELTMGIVLAVDEASTNVIKHAYRGGDNKEIIITVRYSKSKIEIDVTDSGQGFNPDEVSLEDVEKYVKKMKRGGLGLHLIKNMMDEVEFSIEPGVANSVKMVKYIT